MRGKSKKKSNGWKLFVAVLFLIGGFGNIGRDAVSAICGIVIGVLCGAWWWVSVGGKIGKKKIKQFNPEALSFSAVGVSYYTDALTRVGEPARNYDLDDAKLLEKYKSGERLYKYYYNSVKKELLPQPDNPHDSNAVAVMINGEVCGHVPAALCADVKGLLSSGYRPRINVRGGPCKYIWAGQVTQQTKDFQIYIDMTRDQ